MIAALWWWLATPITLARAPIDPSAKLQCVSYAPFRGAQTPLIPTTQISPEQIAQDLAQLARITDCVRTYSIENGLDQVPALAAKVGLLAYWEQTGVWPDFCRDPQLPYDCRAEAAKLTRAERQLAKFLHN